MMILKRKNKRTAVRKWSGYFLAAYFIASWGVNGIINPIHYLRQTVMAEYPASFIEEAEGLVLKQPQGEAEMEFLSFQVKEANNYTSDLQLLGYTRTGKETIIHVKLWQGLNSIELRKYLSDTESDQDGMWEKIVVPRTSTESSGIVLDDVVLSEYRKTDTGRMLSTLASFLLMLAFWEGVWWMKGRYAQ